MNVGLKIDIFTDRDRAQLPALLQLLERYEVKATFFPHLGGERSFLRRWLGGTSAVGGDVWRRIRADGHEVGAVPFDVDAWREQILQRDAAWTHAQMERGREAYVRHFAEPPKVFAAPGSLINADTPELEATMGFEFAMDTRGLHPFAPDVGGRRGACVQLPITLPTIDEVLETGTAAADLHQFLFMESQKPLESGHVFDLSICDKYHLEVVEKLFVMWLGSHRKIVSARQLYEEAAKRGPLPRHAIGLVQSPHGAARFAAQGGAADE